MEVKTNVFLSEADVRVIVKKHLEKQGFKIIGELEIIVKSEYNDNNRKKGMTNGDKIGINVEVEKQFRNRINLNKTKDSGRL
jgi:hypothetical protein